MRYRFFALISRLRNITRWALMRNSYTENVQEHSHSVAVIAHALAVISREVYGNDCDPGYVAAAALYHDASEIYTGDMPTPVKYFNSDIKNAYKKIEALASEKLLSSLPEELQGEFSGVLTVHGELNARLIKAADKLSAYIKCLEELKTGNEEFRLAASQTYDKLLEMNMPEVGYFIEHFIPSFELTLDELDFSE
ncbi:MAG: 5'-deoxynucleotidase [Oscillospiraceae bacterium]|nr:5'-deoxynucleotidase [Oscillospiraceae bacterium]